MKLNEIMKELRKLRQEIIDDRQIIVRLDDKTQSYDDWLQKQGVYDQDVIVVNIWIPST